MGYILKDRISCLSLRGTILYYRNVVHLILANKGAALAHKNSKPSGVCVRLLSLVVLFPLTALSQAIDVTQQGGDLTTTIRGRNAIQVNAPNVTDEERRVSQLAGFGLFHDNFTRRSGLGPDFINSSCGGCHIDNGRGPTTFSNANDGNSRMVIKISLPGLQSNGAPRDVPGIGEQLTDHRTSGTPKSRVNLAWDFVKGNYSDGTKYTLRKPRLSFRINGKSSRGLVSSLRMSPVIIGPGLLEAVPEANILALSDRYDSNRDGISGHPNYVPDVRTQTMAIGRFGFRASHPTTEQQIGAALFHDMGVTNPVFLGRASTPELAESGLRLLTLYQKLAGVPQATRQSEATVVAGKNIFQSIGCNACHTMTMTTGAYPDPELSNQTFHPFTDLLLHNMGPSLADKRAEFSAKGFEWRTTPLWGIGFSKRIARGRPVTYLHDGRARTVEEAILWHGGEAERSKRRFKSLTRDQRRRLLTFLDSL